MANLNDVLYGLVNINSKMAKNINTLLDSVGEGFLDIGSLTFTDNVLTLQNAVILANGSNVSIENSSVELIGNKLCLVEYKSDKTIGLVVVDISDENYTYDSSSLDDTSKYFEVAGLYEGNYEDLRVKGMASKDNSIVKAINGALKAIDYDDSLNLEINLDILSRVSELEVNKADKAYVDNAIANIELPDLDTNIEGVVTADDLSEGTGHIANAYLTKEEFNEHLDNLQGTYDDSLPTNDKTITGAIKELFTNANNGKELIASAIGDKNINSGSTFNAMSEVIISKKDRISQRCQDSSYIPKDNETFDSISDVLDISEIDINQFTKIACGQFGTLALRVDKKVFGCGKNNYYELGLGKIKPLHTFYKNDVSDVKDIAMGSNHALLLREDGSVWSSGDGFNGQLGVNRTSHDFSTKVLSNIKFIACGFDSSYAVDLDDYLWVCGYNDFGQLCLGNTSNCPSFTRTNIDNVDKVFCGYDHVFILKKDGTLWGCGRNDYGQLGLGHLSNISTPEKVDIDDVKSVACGIYHSVLLKNNSYVYACGRNNNKQLGEIGLDTNQALYAYFTNLYVRNVNSIACGYNFTLFSKKDGTLWGCGANTYGQLGLPACTTVPKYTKIPIDDVLEVYCGHSHSFIITNNRTILSCGQNEGRLGHNNGVDTSTFTQVTDFELDSDFITRNLNCILSTEYIEDEPVTSENLIRLINRIKPTAHFIDSIAGSTYVTFIKLSNGEFRSCGEGAYYQLGKDSSTADISILRAWDFLDNVKAVTVASTTSLFLYNDGTLKTCGRNQYGEMGNGTDEATSSIKANPLTSLSLTNIDKIFALYTGFIAVAKDGTAYGWGRDGYGTFGLGDVLEKRSTPTQLPLRDIVDISHGTTVQCFYTLKDGTIWACGYNAYGQLGLGHQTTPIKTPVQFPLTTDEVAYIVGGSGWSAMLKKDGTVWTAGRSTSGCLGFGTVETVSTTFTQIASNVEAISGYSSNLYVLMNDGTVYGCGDNAYKQIANTDDANYVSLTKVEGLVDIKTIHAGLQSLLCIDNNNNMYVVGRNDGGQLGVHNTSTVSSPRTIARGV